MGDRYPIRYIFASGCARAANGHAAAPPTRPMNSRRLTRVPSSTNCETRLADDLVQGALAIAASRLRVPNRVKLRRTHCEQMSSGLPLKADIARCSQHVAFVPDSGFGRSYSNN